MPVFPETSRCFVSVSFTFLLTLIRVYYPHHVGFSHINLYKLNVLFQYKDVCSPCHHQTQFVAQICLKFLIVVLQPSESWDDRPDVDCHAWITVDMSYLKLNLVKFCRQISTYLPRFILLIYFNPVHSFDLMMFFFCFYFVALPNKQDGRYNDSRRQAQL